MTLRDDILANPACDAARAVRDCHAIADLMPARLVPNMREIGTGSIIETIGLDAGNALLDLLMSDSPTSPYRHVKVLLEQGRLQIGSPLARLTVQSLVGAASALPLTQAQADALCALGLTSTAYTQREVAIDLYHDDTGEPL